MSNKAGWGCRGARKKPRLRRIVPGWDRCRQINTNVYFNLWEVRQLSPRTHRIWTSVSWTSATWSCLSPLIGLPVVLSPLSLSLFISLSLSLFLCLLFCYVFVIVLSFDFFLVLLPWFLLYLPHPTYLSLFLSRNLSSSGAFKYIYTHAHKKHTRVCSDQAPKYMCLSPWLPIWDIYIYMHLREDFQKVLGILGKTCVLVFLMPLLVGWSLCNGSTLCIYLAPHNLLSSCWFVVLSPETL